MQRPNLNLKKKDLRIVGKLLLGVVIGIVLVIWLLASCVGAIF